MMKLINIMLLIQMYGLLLSLALFLEVLITQIHELLQMIIIEQYFSMDKRLKEITQRAIKLFEASSDDEPQKSPYKVYHSPAIITDNDFQNDSELIKKCLSLTQENASLRNSLRKQRQKNEQLYTEINSLKQSNLRSQKIFEKEAANIKQKQQQEFKKQYNQQINQYQLKLNQVKQKFFKLELLLKEEKAKNKRLTRFIRCELPEMQQGLVALTTKVENKAENIGAARICKCIDAPQRQELEPFDRCQNNFDHTIQNMNKLNMTNIIDMNIIQSINYTLIKIMGLFQNFSFIFQSNIIYTNLNIMTYRQCRNLCQMLRSLNYPRIISLQNFSKPNFQLVADILYWLTQRYDPQADISDNINQEKDRVQFMRSVVTLFAVKARIKLNPKKLYQADSEAVQQLLKITSILYKASMAKGIEEEQATQFSLPTKVSNLKSHKILSNQICELGAKLFDAISKQPELKAIRSQALSFLQGMTGVNQGNDQAYIENCVQKIMQQQEENTQEMTKYVANMERQQRTLQQKLKKKAADLQRAEKRYRSLVTVKPAFMQEYQRLEKELQKLYQVYVEKYRNLDYLQNELEIYNKAEQKKVQKTKQALEKLRKKVQEDQIKNFRADDELNEGLLDPQQERGFTRGKSRKVQRGFNENKDVSQESDENQSEQQQSGEEIQDEDNSDDSDF